MEKETDVGTKLRAEKVAEATREETILEEAERIVMGDREEKYGHPRNNHLCTAALWNTYLKRRRTVTHQLEPRLTAEDVCMLNILQKISRCANKTTRDSLVDIAGWARCVERIIEPKITKPAYRQSDKHIFIPTNPEGYFCDRCDNILDHDLHIDKHGNRV